MKTYVQKWGNSLALRIPKAFAEELGLEPNGAVELLLVEGHLKIVPQTRPQTLEDLVARITPENTHDETDWGPPVGDEVW
jgi:antitoxin MazE